MSDVLPFLLKILSFLKDRRICSCLKAVEEMEDCPDSLKYQSGGNGVQLFPV